jgi:predicted MPP superfamily phosphohydrolase
VINGEWTRVRHITLKLPLLPESWRGRTAVLVSDLHLGNYHAFGFVRRIARRVLALRPDVVFIAGDLYDGTPADLARLAEPLRMLKPPLGAFLSKATTKNLQITPSI